MDMFFFRKQGSDEPPQAPRVFAVMHIFQGILGWLAALVRFTEEEQREAGIVLGDQRYQRHM